MSKGNVLIHLSGSISCFKACTLASLLVKEGYTVQTTASEAALKFVGKATLEGITGQVVLTDLFGGVPDYTPHITLAQRWADLILAYPASANLLNRLAAGLCDDLFGAICLANNFHTPLWLAPAMNSEMFAHPAVCESIRKLESWGALVLPTEEGRLACGSIGPGRLLAPEIVLEMIKEALCGCS
jgi:phosphopantothenoylcysteine decarboxylase